MELKHCIRCNRTPKNCLCYAVNLPFRFSVVSEVSQVIDDYFCDQQFDLIHPNINNDRTPIWRMNWKSYWEARKGRRL